MMKLVQHLTNTTYKLPSCSKLSLSLSFSLSRSRSRSLDSKGCSYIKRTFTVSRPRIIITKVVVLVILAVVLCISGYVFGGKWPLFNVIIIHFIIIITIHFNCISCINPEN